MVDSILADLIRIQVRQSIVDPLSRALSGVVGGIFGGIGGASGSASSLGFGGSDPLGLSGIDPANVIRLDLAALKFQTGGLIPGALGAGPDSVLARLTPGEFVVNAQATRAYLPLLEAINDAPGFQYGGRVDASTFQLPAGVAPQAAAPNVIINVTSQVPGVEVEAQARPPGGPRGDVLIDVTVAELLGRMQRRGQLGDLLGGYGVQKRLKDRG